jgi:predicted nucleotidyltransferase
MSIQNEEEIEEILHNAHMLGIHTEVIERAIQLLKQNSRLDRCDVYYQAIKEIREEHGV